MIFQEGRSLCDKTLLILIFIAVLLFALNQLIIFIGWAVE
jgi:hypothetical protein